MDEQRGVPDVKPTNSDPNISSLNSNLPPMPILRKKTLSAFEKKLRQKGRQTKTCRKSLILPLKNIDPKVNVTNVGENLNTSILSDSPSICTFSQNDKESNPIGEFTQPNQSFSTNNGYQQRNWNWNTPNLPSLNSKSCFYDSRLVMKSSSPLSPQDAYKPSTTDASTPSSARQCFQNPVSLEEQLQRQSQSPFQTSRLHPQFNNLRPTTTFVGQVPEGHISPSCRYSHDEIKQNVFHNQNLFQQNQWRAPQSYSHPQQIAHPYMPLPQPRETRCFQSQHCSQNPLHQIQHLQQPKKEFQISSGRLPLFYSPHFQTKLNASDAHQHTWGYRQNPILNYKMPVSYLSELSETATDDSNCRSIVPIPRQQYFNAMNYSSSSDFTALNTVDFRGPDERLEIFHKREKKTSEPDSLIPFCDSQINVHTNYKSQFQNNESRQNEEHLSFPTHQTRNHFPYFEDQFVSNKVNQHQALLHKPLSFRTLQERCHQAKPSLIPTVVGSEPNPAKYSVGAAIPEKSVLTNTLKCSKSNSRDKPSSTKQLTKQTNDLKRSCTQEVHNESDTPKSENTDLITFQSSLLENSRAPEMFQESVISHSEDKSFQEQQEARDENLMKSVSPAPDSFNGKNRDSFIGDRSCEIEHIIVECVSDSSSLDSLDCDADYDIKEQDFGYYKEDLSSYGTEFELNLDEIEKKLSNEIENEGITDHEMPINSLRPFPLSLLQTPNFQ